MQGVPCPCHSSCNSCTTALRLPLLLAGSRSTTLSCVPRTGSTHCWMRARAKGNTVSITRSWSTDNQGPEYTPRLINRCTPRRAACKAPQPPPHCSTQHAASTAAHTLHRSDFEPCWSHRARAGPVQLVAVAVRRSALLVAWCEGGHQRGVDWPGRLLEPPVRQGRGGWGNTQHTAGSVTG